MTTAIKPRLLAATMLLLISPGAWSQNVTVIANPDVKPEWISISDLRSVFLQEKNFLGGRHVEPVLGRSGPAHDAFLRLYMGRTDSDLQTYYRSLVFTGRGAMPKILHSDAEVVAYVARTSGAIGYIRPETSAVGVRVLAIVSATSNLERKLIFRVEPDYPEVLRARSIGGTVRLQVTIAPSGSVKHVHVKGGDAALAEAAAKAVTRWKYSPAPSQSSTEVAITFDPKTGVR